MSIKVLIVEDEFIVANDLRLVLVQAGYKVTGIASSTEEADEQLQKHMPDLVLLDIQLKGKLSGIDLARKLRAGNIPFIYLSAYSSQKILEEAKTTEPYGFLVKPFREMDLLVAIDIALYRHQHSLESKLRQEDFLQKQLEAISNESSNAEQKLLTIARLMQASLPFDFIAMVAAPCNDAQLNDIGYLRIGFDEYQFIGEKELMTITGLKNTDRSLITENNDSDNVSVIYGNITTEQKPAVHAFQKIYADAFKLQSYLALPVRISNGTSFYYFFYSRQLTTYTQQHVALLNRLKIGLTGIAETMATTKQPAATSNKNNDAVRLSVFNSIIGSHPLLLAALDLAWQVGPYNTSVLILGESGTGKEKVAQSIHALSPRKNGPFIKINCAAIPPTLIESELFGHEKGAFTGATEKRKGRFEQADGGTIFLDEVGELPLEMQVKLLRVLQEKEIEYLGGGSPIKVDVRIVAATNRNLEKEVAEGNFRLDLYYRLNVFPITLPALRERKTDIEVLAVFFANKFCREFNKPFMGIATSMMNEMFAYNWPGNIRELENVLEQSVILNDGKSIVTLKRSLPAAAAELPGKPNIETLEDVKQMHRQTERDYIISILKKANGRIRGANGAAELLHIKPTTLEAKMARLMIKRTDFIPAAGE